MFKVICSNCNRTRYWDELKDFNPDECPECGSNNITFNETDVTEEI